MKRRGVNVFLAETIIMTAVLAIGLSMCLGAFLSASRMRQRAADLSLGASLVYSAVQCYAATGDIAQTSVLMGGDGGDVSVDGLTLSFSQRDGHVLISALRGDETVFSSETPAEVVK